MKTIKTKLLYYLFLLVIVISFFVMAIRSIITPLNSDNSITIEASDFSPDFSERLLELSDNPNNTYSVDLLLNQFPETEDDHYRLIVFNLKDNACRITINGHLLGHYGDMTNGNSSLRAGLTEMVIAKDVLQESNTLVIDTYANYRTGLSSEVVYITTPEAGREILNMHFWGDINWTLIGIGFCLLSTVFALFIFFLSRGVKKHLLFSGLGTFFLSLYFIDHLNVLYLYIPYLTYKKLIIGSLYLGLFFIFKAIFICVNSKKLVIIFNSILIIAMISIFMSGNMISFKPVYSYGLMIFLVIALIIAGIYRKQLLNNKNVRLYYGTVSTAFIFACIQLLLDVFNVVSFTTTPFVYILLLSLLTMIIALDDLNIQHHALIDAQEDKEKAFIQSMTDALTGVWNISYYYAVAQTKDRPETIALIDFDDFKFINDNYGHPAGDTVLKEFCRLFFSTVSESFDLIRYGGDEFIVLFYNTNISNAYIEMEKFLNTLDITHIYHKKKLLTLSVSVGLYETKVGDTPSNMLEKVDKKLYESKNQGKHTIRL